MDFRLLLGLGALSLPFIPPIAHAQITPDGSLNTTITTIGPNTTITNGSAIGPNLFHSFGQFSIPTGGSATFDLTATPTIRTLFSRITGSSPSTIDGLIRTTHPVSLFLINPAGIVFGPKAQLNIGGSLIATTANRIQFADGSSFPATPNATPLLTLSIPIGLQFNGNNGSIQVQGNGNDGIVPTLNLGILNSPSQTIALIGGQVHFTGGVITAPAGRIEIGAVDRGLVSLSPSPVGWQLGYTQVQTLQDITFTNRSSLWNPNPIGNSAGGIQVVGRDITLNQSQIAAATTGPGEGGAIAIQAQRSLSLAGVNANANAPSAWIVNQVATGATGQGGSVTIQAETVSLREGAAIETLSLGSGAAGNIQVTAKTLSATGTVVVKSPLLPSGSSNSRISTTAYQSGAGGNIAVTAPHITFTDSGQIATYVLAGATGQGGNINVEATDITAIGLNPLSFSPSGIQAYTLGIGNSGTVRVSTDQLNLADSGGVFTLVGRIAGTANTGIGNASDLTVVARQGITIVGVSRNQPDLISYLGSVTTGSGQSGNVSITAAQLSVQAGGGSGTTTLPIVGKFGDRAQSTNLGNAGNVAVNIAEQIEVSGINPFTQTPSSLGATTFGNGNTGSVTIQTNQLRVQNGGAITALTAATGNAGTLTIRAEEILVEGKSSQRSSIVASAPILNRTTRQFYRLPDFPTGNNGIVNIITHRLTVRDQATINVRHQGTGDAGQLSIQAQSLSLDHGSIEALTASGQGGNLNLQVQNSLVLRQGSQITATSGGNGNGGNITIAARFIVGAENSDIVANASQGRGGNIQITAQGIFGLQFRPQLTPNNDITASSQFGLNGTVQINNLGVNPRAELIALPVTLVDPSQQIATGCNTQGSRFVVTGRGGLPPNPTESIGRDRPWSDIRDLSQLQPHQPTVPLAPSPIVEATGLSRTATGGLELIAPTSPTLGPVPVTCASAIAD